MFLKSSLTVLSKFSVFKSCKEKELPHLVTPSLNNFSETVSKRGIKVTSDFRWIYYFKPQKLEFYGFLQNLASFGQNTLKSHRKSRILTRSLRSRRCWIIQCEVYCRDNKNLKGEKNICRKSKGCISRTQPPFHYNILLSVQYCYLV